jgi:hypothetical protein
VNQTGRKQATDIKRRMIAACRDAALRVQGAKFYLLPDGANRFVQVDAVTPDGPCQKSVIGIRTVVHIDGEWSGCVSIGCIAAQDNLDIKPWDSPILEGRECVLIDDLVKELRETVEERDQVVAARRLGIDGPYIFDLTLWATPSDTANG